MNFIKQIETWVYGKHPKSFHIFLLGLHIYFSVTQNKKQAGTYVNIGHLACMKEDWRSYMAQQLKFFKQITK